MDPCSYKWDRALTSGAILFPLPHPSFPNRIGPALWTAPPQHRPSTRRLHLRLPSCIFDAVLPAGSPVLAGRSLARAACSCHVETAAPVRAYPNLGCSSGPCGRPGREALAARSGLSFLLHMRPIGSHGAGQCYAAAATALATGSPAWLSFSPARRVRPTGSRGAGE